jgi:hypothetical protein
MPEKILPIDSGSVMMSGAAKKYSYQKFTAKPFSTSALGDKGTF